MITGLENQSKRMAKKTLIEWTEAANSPFETLKGVCTSTPILAYPDYQLPFSLLTDISSEGLGAVLYQKQEGKLRVVAYVSRSVSKTDSNYPAHKLEFLALKWAMCEKFHEYLCDAKTFDIYVASHGPPVSLVGQMGISVGHIRHFCKFLQNWLVMHTKCSASPKSYVIMM